METNKKERLKQIVEKLEELSSVEGSELGEYWSNVSNLWSSYRYCASEEFTEALEKELFAINQDIIDNYEVVEEEVEQKYTSKQKTLKHKIYG